VSKSSIDRALRAWGRSSHLGRTVVGSASGVPRRAPPPVIVAHLLRPLDRYRVFAGRARGGVGDHLEVFRPQQRQQIVGRSACSFRLLQHREEAHDFQFLDARLERERADAVLEERPRDAFVALVLVIDELSSSDLRFAMSNTRSSVACQNLAERLRMLSTAR